MEAEEAAAQKRIEAEVKLNAAKKAAKLRSKLSKELAAAKEREKEAQEEVAAQEEQQEAVGRRREELRDRREAAVRAASEKRVMQMEVEAAAKQGRM